MGHFVQAIYCAIGLAFVGGGVFFLFQIGVLGLLFAVSLSLAGAYCWRWAMRSRFTLTETEISVRYAFDEDFAEVSEIESWRTESGGKSGSYWTLQLRNDVGSMRIDQRFAVDDAFFDFLSKLRNLNDGEISVVP